MENDNALSVNPVNSVVSSQLLSGQCPAMIVAPVTRYVCHVHHVRYVRYVHYVHHAHRQNHRLHRLHRLIQIFQFPTTDNRQRITGTQAGSGVFLTSAPRSFSFTNRQQTTDNRQPTTDNRQPTTDSPAFTNSTASTNSTDNS